VTVKEEETEEEEDEEEEETPKGGRLDRPALAPGPARVMESGPRVTLAAAPAPAPDHDAPPGGAGASGVTLKKEEEEEETLGQLRDRQVLAAARAGAPGPRARFVHIKVEDSSSGEDTDGEGGGGGGVEATGGEGDGEVEKEEKEEADEEGAVEEEAEPRDLRAHAPGTSGEGGSTRSVPKRACSRVGARSEPGSPRARLRTPGRVADNAVQDNDVQHPEEQEEDEEAGSAPILQKRGSGGRAVTSQFAGVSWAMTKNKWLAQCKGKHLGCHATEKDAARAYNRYLEDGIDPVKSRKASSHFVGVSWNIRENKWKAQCKGTYLGLHTTEADAVRAYNDYLEDGIDLVKHRVANTSHIKGVSWNTESNKWEVSCKGTYLGKHATEEDAARAYSKYLEDGIDPIEHRGANTSQCTGVSWHKRQNKWAAASKGTHLGAHTTEAEAARACSKFLKDGIDPVKHREARTSQFKGVSWNKQTSRWRATCTGKYLGSHATEEEAMHAYTVEAERRRRPLNVILPAEAGAAGTGVGPGAGSLGTGPKRAGAVSLMSTCTDDMKWNDTLHASGSASLSRAQ